MNGQADLFEIPRFLLRTAVDKLAAERGITAKQASTLLFWEDHPPALPPRHRTRKGPAK